MTDELPVVQENELELNDAPRKVWIRVRDAVGLLWEGNPKRHDVGSLVQSVQRYGFQDTPKYDANLPNVSGGTGAIKAGNGRVEVLALMERDGSYELPRGLGLDGDGAWAMPVDVGTDARSRAEAEAYAIDDNNLTVLGGDLTGFDAAMMYDDSYIPILRHLVEADDIPISTDGEFLDLLLRTTGEEVSPWGSFGDLPDSETVRFSFGGYSGQVSRTVFVSFEREYLKRRERDALMDNVLRSWLGV